MLRNDQHPTLSKDNEFESHCGQQCFILKFLNTMQKTSSMTLIHSNRLIDRDKFMYVIFNTMVAEFK